MARRIRRCKYESRTFHPRGSLVAKGLAQDGCPSQTLWVACDLSAVGLLLFDPQQMDPMAKAALIREGLGWVASLLPGLQIYAAAYFGIPAFRWVHR